MRKEIFKSIFFLFIVFVVAVFLFLFIEKVGWRKVPEIPVVVEDNSCSVALKSFSALYRATSEIGSIPYDSESANCYDHSKLLTEALRKENIKSSIMVNADRSHSWVAVWIESNTGQFVPVSNTNEILEIRDGADVTKVQCYNNSL